MKDRKYQLTATYSKNIVDGWDDVWTFSDNYSDSYLALLYRKEEGFHWRVEHGQGGRMYERREHAEAAIGRAITVRAKAFLNGETIVAIPPGHPLGRSSD